MSARSKRVLSENTNVAMRAGSGLESGDAERCALAITAARPEQWTRRGP